MFSALYIKITIISKFNCLIIFIIFFIFDTSTRKPYVRLTLFYFTERCFLIGAQIAWSDTWTWILIKPYTRNTLTEPSYYSWRQGFTNHSLRKGFTVNWNFIEIAIWQSAIFKSLKLQCSDKGIMPDKTAL